MTDQTILRYGEWLRAYILVIVTFFVAIDTCWASTDSHMPPLPSICEEMLELTQSESADEIFLFSTPTDSMPPTIDEYHFKGRLASERKKNQCGFGSCWAAAPLGKVENTAFHNGYDIDLSIEYMVMTQLLEDTILYLDKYTSGDGKKRFVQIGGSEYRALNTIKKFGVLPDAVWTPKRRLGRDRFQDARLYSRIRVEQEVVYKELSQLRKSLSNIKETLRLVIERTGQNRNLKQHMNPLQWKLFQNNLDMLGLETTDIANPASIPAIEEAPAYKQLQEGLKVKVWTILIAYLGLPSEKFEVNGNEYNPKTFIESFDGFAGDDLQQLIQHPEEINRDDIGSHNFLKLIVEELERTRRPLLASSNLPLWAYDDQTGAFDTSMFTPVGINTANLLLMNQPPRTGYPSHALMIVDYHLDDAGEIDWFLVQNSWGNQRGDSGYLHLSRETFDALFKEIVIAKR